MPRPTKQFALDRKRGIWKAYYHFAGQRAIQRTLIKDIDLNARARTKEQKTSLLHQLYAEKFPTESSPKSKESSAFEIAKRAFLEFVANERSAKTLKDYGHTLRNLNSFDEIDQLKQTWLSAGQSPNTVNKKIRTIRAFENWRVEQENNERGAKALPLIHARKFRNIKTDPANIASYTNEQADAILRLIEDRIADPPVKTNHEYHCRWELLRRAWYLMRFAGLRGAEVLSLRWQDVELNPLPADSWISINSHEDARGNWFQVKQHHVAEIEIIYDDLVAELESWARDHKFILRGHWQTSTELGRAFKRLQAELNIDAEIKPLHGFRAMFATELHNFGASLKDVKDQLRHSSIETTERYIDKRNNARGKKLRALTANAA